MSDALSELTAFLASISRQQQQQQQQQHQHQHHQHQQQQQQDVQQSNQNRIPNTLTLQHPPGLPPIPTQPPLPGFIPGIPPNIKPLTEQELLMMFNSSNNQIQNTQSNTTSLLSSIPLPNPEYDFDFNRTSLLEDEFQKLTFNNNPNNEYKNINNNNNNNNNNSINNLNNFDKKYNTNINKNIENSNNVSLNDTTSTNPDIIYSSNKYYMPGTASLIEDVDKQLMVILRDGKTLIGYLRSIDQYANLLLSNTIERIYVGNKYGDIPRGVYIIRGENVVLIGEVDFNKPLKVDLVKVDVNEILELKKIEELKQQEIEKNKKKALLNRCILPQTDSILDDYY